MKILIKTFGCTANHNDSEIMAGILKKKGHILVADVNDADAVVINTCIVKGKTETVVKNYLRKVKASGKKIVVAGCMPSVMKEKIEAIAPKASIIGHNDIGRIAEAASKRTVSINGRRIVKPCSSKARSNPVVNITQISMGCKGSCSYCIVKLIKKDLMCFPAEKIVKDAEEAVKDGCKELWITSQDNAAYNYKGIKLPELLEKTAAIKGNFYVRNGMMNPEHVKPILKPLIKAYKNPKMFKFIHIPVQSGSNEILKAMNRRYTVNDFRKIVAEFRKEIPDITLSTDIIVGFPGETEKQFNGSLQLIEELKPDTVNISRFWPRQGTKAAEMKNIANGNETKRRSQKLTALFKAISLEKNKKWLGWKGKILIDEKGRHGAMAGRNYAYKQIVVKGNFGPGEELNVKVTEAKRHDLRAELAKAV